MADDPFDEVLGLEERFYDEGYKQGTEEGIQAGKIEGRALGLEKGFEKFLESGRLYGKSLVWASRLPRTSAPQNASSSTSQGRGDSSTDTDKGEKQQLPLLSRNARLEKNIPTLYALVEPDTLSTENTDEAVNDFDDRVKRAHGKARIIDKMVGEEVSKEAHQTRSPASEGNKEGTPEGPATKSPSARPAVEF